MIATVVTSSLNAAQVFSLLAAFAFFIAAIVTYPAKAWWGTLVCIGLFLASIALMFGLPG